MVEVQPQRNLVKTKTGWLGVLIQLTNKRIAILKFNARDTVLCSSARHFTMTVPLST